MKWKCTYIPEEQEEAAADLAALLRNHPGARVRRNDRRTPYRHIYVTIPERNISAAVGESLDTSPQR